MRMRTGFNVDNAGVYTCSGWNVDEARRLADIA